MKRTALFDEHKALNGRMVDFGGWELPVQYTGVMDEHTACRTAAGLFDVSHMGEVIVEGPDSVAFLNYLVSNNVSKMYVGQAQYSAMCNDDGGIVDDLIVYRQGEQKFLVVVNASNTDKDFAWMQSIRDRRKFDIVLENHSDRYTQIAIQGPKATAILQTLTETELSTIKTYAFAEGRVCGSIPAILARTGYTGEDGFEVYVPWNDGPKVWRALLSAGAPHGLKACGLGARDTLRLEVKYPLYGHELSDTTNPIEAGLGWATKLDKGEFVGRDPIVAAKEAGLRRKLVGIRLNGAGIPRQGYKLFTADASREIGEVTSGTQSPSLKLPIAIAYVPVTHSEVGSQLTVDIRGNKIPAEVVPTPFYKRPY